MSHIKAEIVADSLNTATNDRITTFLLEYPRICHSELLTHRLLSRNTASSRAVPVQRMLERLETKYFVPYHWGANQKGMQAKKELGDVESSEAKEIWMEAFLASMEYSQSLASAGVHKQLANRLTEPFQIIQCVVTATQWKNFFTVRNHPDAQPEFMKLARLMEIAHKGSVPSELNPNEWHLPFISEDEKKHIVPEYLVNDVSSARCARASYYIKEDQQFDITSDLDLADKLSSSGHMSPFEHVAVALPQHVMCGNFVGWLQYRKMFENESNGDIEEIPILSPKQAITLLNS